MNVWPEASLIPVAGLVAVVAPDSDQFWSVTPQLSDVVGAMLFTTAPQIPASLF